MHKGILLILDGYGEAEAGAGNAVRNAKTPTLNKIKSKGHALLKTSGEAVGLFKGEMGGSEVGHTTIGAGRIIPSTALEIKQDIKNKNFENNPKILKILNELKKNKSDLHLFGLMSDKNIHSDIKHCIKLIEMAKEKANNIYIHFVTDGRDCGERDSVKYLKQLNKAIKGVENCHILSVSGRFYAMDRENYLERTKTALNSMFFKENPIKESEIEKYIKNQHNNKVNDQYIVPAYVESKTYKQIGKNDCIFFFNFREDRLRQIVKACEQFKCKLVTMANVGGVSAISIYQNKNVEHTLSEHLSNLNLKQIKISETTKYAHVTFFLNGGREEPFTGEDRVHVPTIETNNYALTPKMQAKEITKQVKLAIKKGYDAIIVNYSNPDMIGHTGDYLATVKALKFLDKCVKQVLSSAKKNNYFTLLTADHGNSEEMINKNGEPHTAHSLNDVFCAVVNKNVKLKANGELKDVAPTFLELMDVAPNPYFNGSSLIIK